MHDPLNRRENWFWSKLCTTVTHEYGHLLGRKHTWTLGSVMYPGWPNPEWGKRFHSCDFTYDDPEEAEPEPELDEDYYCDEYDPDCLGESEDGNFYARSRWAPHSAAQEAAEWRRLLTQLRDDLDHLVDEDPRSAGAARPPDWTEKAINA